MDETLAEKARRARRRALRAAQVVTISTALAGCAMTHGRVDSGRETDAGELADAGELTDADFDAGVDAGEPECLTMEDAQRSRDCCEGEPFYGYWEDDRCHFYIEGPRVPPSMNA